MRIGFVVLPFILLGIVPSSGIAKSTCADVYINANSNLTVVDRQSARYSYAFAKHCESNGSMKSSSETQDLSADILDYVDVEWKGTKADALQTMQKFCKTQHTVAASADRYSMLTNTIVTSALESFNQCVALDRSGVNITHVASTSDLLITGDFDAGKDRVTLKSVRFTPGAGVCDVITTKTKKVTRVQEKMPPMELGGQFSVACRRTGVATQGGETKYPRFEVIVGTSQGDYTVTLLPEDVQGYDLASETKRMLARADAQNLALKKEMDERIAAEQAKTSAALARAPEQHIYVIGDGFGVPCAYPGNAPTAEAHVESVCSGKRPIIGEGVLVSASTGRCGVNAVSFVCVDR